MRDAAAALQVLFVLDLPHGDIPDVFFVETAAAAPVVTPILAIPPKHLISKPVPIFNALSDEQVAALRARFAGSQESAAPAPVDATAAAAAAAAAAAPGGKKGKSGGGAKGGGAAAPAAASAAPQSEMARVELRVGVIKRAWPHPEADKLWCEEVDIGEDKPRMVASGLRQYYSQEAMTGRRIVVVANLKPRTMVGFESQGMVLCASNDDRSVVEFVEPPAGARVSRPAGHSHA